MRRAPAICFGDSPIMQEQAWFSLAGRIMLA
jgi:hypothetical protein